MPVTYRQPTLDDQRTLFTIFIDAISDLGERQGNNPFSGPADPEFMSRMWEARRPLFEHCHHTAEFSWMAESDGEAIGYARTIRRGDERELTEFFVRPGSQSAGVGRELLSRAFPVEGAEHRTIIATTDVRAQARYLKTGVYPRFPIQYLSREPEAVTVDTDLTITPLSGAGADQAAMNAIDQAVLGHQREIDHGFFQQAREGFLYQRGAEVVGYGYLGRASGPFALLDPADYPAVLAHAETYAAQHGYTFGFEVPMINSHAVDHLMARGCELSPFVTLFMSNVPPHSKFDRYICVNPPFFY